ncbi:MAG: cell wall-binding repeat-containing protein, partial [Clostridia bacterium]|nr:cell wall-binding repeat-containing protein [Clostridia bacterium]
MSRRKSIAILAIIAMVLTLMPAAMFGATADSDRLAGANRIETALKICDAGWETADTVILAAADEANLVDALAACPLAAQENAPILVTYKNALHADVKAKIADLGASKVIVVGAASDDLVA